MGIDYLDLVMPAMFGTREVVIVVVYVLPWHDKHGSAFFTLEGYVVFVWHGLRPPLVVIVAVLSLMQAG